MIYLKKYALFTITTLAIIGLVAWSLDAFGFRDPLFAFLLNWLLMSWAAIVGQAVHFSFPKTYYEIKRFEGTGRFYEYLGIRWFKALVRRGPLSILSPSLRFPKERTLSGLQGLDAEMRKAETSHGIVFVLVLGFVGYALLRGWLDSAGWMLLFNLLLNGYPIMLQRYNRIKLNALIRSLPIQG
jgi:hypothetical protein